MFQVVARQSEVRVPIWSDKNGQDDLTCYHADKQSDRATRFM
ncbi:MAG: GBS Bsp-like repeat-containing protein [Streptococcus sp.]